MIEKLALVALGGALGAALRFLGIGLAARLFGATHWGTMTINVIGSILMGVLVILMFERLNGGAERLAPLLMTGVLGGFTTFSAFSLDAMKLLEAGQANTALLYIAGSVVLSIAGLMAGMTLARGVFG